MAIRRKALACSESEETEIILQAGANEITKAAFPAWVERTVVVL